MTRTNPRLFVLIVAMFLLACGASARQDTLNTASMALNAARDGALSYDAKHQDEIAHSGPQTREGALAAQSALVAYRAKWKTFETSMAVAYDALIVAIRINDERSFAALKAALPAAIDAYLTLKGKP